MDDRRSRHGRPRRRSARRVRDASSEHGYRHIPVVDDDAARRHRLDARPHAHRDDPAGRGPGPRGPEGPRRRRRRRDDRRRRPRPRRLLPLPPVQRGRPRASAPLEDVWHLLFEGALPETLAERDAFAAEIRAAPRRSPTPSRDVLAGDRARRRARSCRSTCCAPRSRSTAPRSASGRRSTSTHATLYDNALSTCAVVPTLITALWRLRQGLEPVDPHDDLGYAANYLYMMHGEVPRARARGRRSRSTSSRRSTTGSTRRRSPHASSRRPAPTSAPRSSARSARSPDRCTAARRAARSQMLDEIGTADHAEPWLRDAVERGDRLMGFGHRVYKTDDPRSVHAARRRRRARRREDGARPAHRGDRDRGARRAEARAAGCTRTSSSTPAS